MPGTSSGDGRASGFRVRHFRTIVRRSGGRDVSEGVRPSTASAASGVPCAESTASPDASASTTPSENMSLRGPTCWASNCSGEA